jgi:hypothetical protein
LLTRTALIMIMTSFGIVHLPSLPGYPCILHKLRK